MFYHSDVFVELEEKSEDDQSHEDSSSRDHDCTTFHNIILFCGICLFTTVLLSCIKIELTIRFTRVRRRSNSVTCNPVNISV